MIWGYPYFWKHPYWVSMKVMKQFFEWMTNGNQGKNTWIKMISGPWTFNGRLMIFMPIDLGTELHHSVSRTFRNIPEATKSCLFTKNVPGGGGKGIRMSKNKEELEQNFVQVQHLGCRKEIRRQISSSLRPKCRTVFLLRSEVPGSPVFMMQLCILDRYAFRRDKLTGDVRIADFF